MMVSLSEVRRGMARGNQIARRKEGIKSFLNWYLLDRINLDLC